MHEEKDPTPWYKKRSFRQWLAEDSAPEATYDKLIRSLDSPFFQRALKEKQNVLKNKALLAVWNGGEFATEADVEALYWFKRTCDAKEITDAEYRAFKKWYSKNGAHQSVFQHLIELWGRAYIEFSLKKQGEEFFEQWEHEPVTDTEIQAGEQFKKISDVEVSDEDYAEFKQWLAEDEANQTLYEEFQELWDNPYFELALKERHDIQKNGFLKTMNWGDMAALMESNDKKPMAETVLQAVRWYRILWSGEKISEEEWRVFKRWWREDAIHRVIYDEVVELRNNQYFQWVVEKLEKAQKQTVRLERYRKYADVAKKLFGLAYSGVMRGCRGGVQSWRAMGLTAVAASLLVVASFIWVTDISDIGPRSTLYQTAVGEQRKFALADGTNVILNTDTQLHVTFNEDSRKVALSQGEAYFDVAKDSGRPFLVEGGTGLVKVLGTAFEVKVSRDKMAVSVERGRVAVSPLHSKAESVEVTPRRQVDVTHYRLGAVEYLPLHTTLADWRDGMLDFDNKPLDEVIAELDRYYGGSISLGDRYLSGMRVKGQYNIQDARKAIKSLATNMELELATSDTGDIVLFVRK